MTTRTLVESVSGRLDKATATSFKRLRKDVTEARSLAHALSMALDKEYRANWLARKGDKKNRRAKRSSGRL